MKTTYAQGFFRSFDKKGHPVPERRRRRFPCALLQVCLGMALLWCGSAAAAPDSDLADAPSYGKGPKELIVFSDYFCPPCMTIEADLEPAIQKLLAKGDVKVTFVDFPGHQQTALYAKYFLYAANGATGYKNAMHARNVLFTLSKQNLAKTDGEIEKAFKEQGVVFKPFSPKPVYAEWNKIIKKHKIKTTPTCIMKHSEADVRVYEGSVEIRNGLFPELDAPWRKSKS